MRMACGERRGSAAGHGLRGPAAAVSSPALLVELVVHAVDQGLPARLDHVVRHAHRPPALVLVARLDEHAHHRLGALLVAEHAHLVVVEPDVLDLGVELAEGLAQRAVEGVDRPVPLRRRVLDLPVRAFQHDGRLVDHAKADQAVEAHAVAVDRLAHEELERRLGPLEGEALRLEVLQVAEERRHRRLVRLEVEAETGRLVEEVRASGQVRNQHALAVADQVRVDVLVGGRVLLHRGHVEPALVSEGALSDEGQSAFAHKGGLHVAAVQKNPTTYEHIDPDLVGNSQRVLVSDLAGRSNLLYKAARFGLDLESNQPAVTALLRDLKDLEAKGFAFEGAEASFELLMRKAIDGDRVRFYRLIGFRVIDEATIMLEGPDGQIEHTAAQGNGPVNALDRALRKALGKFYPEVEHVRLHDYKVRVLGNEAGTEAVVRVLIESGDEHERWGTVGVSHNVIEASWQALVDSMDYKLYKERRGGHRRRAADAAPRG